MKTEFGIIGIGVMGKSLARNFAEKGFRLSLFNRHLIGAEENVASDFIQNFSELNNFQGFDDLRAFVISIKRPRKILIMVNAGEAVDLVIEGLLNHMNPEDILIDGGNSHYKDTNLRMKRLINHGIHYIGMGISGGEEGALKGPSLMPGGRQEAYALIEHYLLAIAAKDSKGNPCCRYIGNEGAGHFVKMVHNGIEYAEMQLIAEIYSILRFNNKLDPDEISLIFEDWNNSPLENYLLKSTAVILRHKEGHEFLIDLILDKASHKGTGSWTTIAAAELGVPFTMSSAALNARFISALKNLRSKLSGVYKKNPNELRSIEIENLKDAYHVARIVNHHQGFQLIKEASNAYNWNIDIKDVAGVWINGCIIASGLMNNLERIIDKHLSILEINGISEEIHSNHEQLRSTVISALNANLPVPCLSESLTFLNGISEALGSGNIIQAQRDYFGAHSYKRLDDPNGPSHHTNWNN